MLKPRKKCKPSPSWATRTKGRDKKEAKQKKRWSEGKLKKKKSNQSRKENWEGRRRFHESYMKTSSKTTE